MRKTFLLAVLAALLTCIALFYALKPLTEQMKDAANKINWQYIPYVPK